MRLSSVFKTSPLSIQGIAARDGMKGRNQIRCKTLKVLFSFIFFGLGSELFVSLGKIVVKTDGIQNLIWFGFQFHCIFKTLTNCLQYFMN